MIRYSTAFVNNIENVAKNQMIMTKILKKNIFKVLEGNYYFTKIGNFRYCLKN